MFILTIYVVDQRFAVFMMVKSTHKIQYMKSMVHVKNLDRYEADQTIYVNGIPYANPAVP